MNGVSEGRWALGMIMKASAWYLKVIIWYDFGIKSKRLVNGC